VASLNSIIDLVHPTVSGVGVTVNDQVWVLFDRAMDEDSLSAGCFFVTGPDFDTWKGINLDVYNDALSNGSGSDDVLESPGFEGIVQGTYSFERISLTTLDTVETEDVVGSGHLYRTKAIFSPTNRLQCDTTYQVHLSGDDDGSDAGHMGVSARTVFDTAPVSGINLGGQAVQFTGGYIGSYPDRFEVKITTSGEVGTARFSFERDSEPGNVFGPFRTKRSGILLADCVTVEFPDEGQYIYGDRWDVVVKPREIFEGNVLYPFKTGSGSIAELPATTSTTVLGDIPAPESVTATATAAFSVSSVSPVDNATNLQIPAGEYTVRANFNSAVDAATVTSGVSASVAIQDVQGEGHPVELPAEPSVSGSQISIVVPSGSLPNNKVVYVTLDSTIQGVNGVALGEDYQWTFTTVYSPMYSTLRRIRLSIGNFIQDVPDDTINLAIYMASVMAGEMTWNVDGADNDYYEFVRQQWAHCKAEELLLMNTIGGAGSLKSKKLGDLQVEYNTSQAITPALDRALECQAKWEGALMSGGRQEQTAQGVVKGALDPDRPPIGRGWMHTRSSAHRQTPAANRKTLYTSHRRYYNRHARGWWNR
jgi:hypothetical protein